MNNTSQMGIPVTFINHQAVIGFDRARLEQLLTQTEGVQRPSFGASIADASKITAKQGSGITFRAYIGKVRPGSVARRIGLTSGDIIEMNMKNIANASDLERALSGLNRSRRLSLVFLRGNKKLASEGIY